MVGGKEVRVSFPEDVDIRKLLEGRKNSRAILPPVGQRAQILYKFWAHMIAHTARISEL